MAIIDINIEIIAKSIVYTTLLTMMLLEIINRAELKMMSFTIVGCEVDLKVVPFIGIITALLRSINKAIWNVIMGKSHIIKM